MDRTVMEAALAEARSSLAEYSAKAAKIKAKVDALQSVVSGLEMLLGARPNLDTASPNATASGNGKPDSTWKLAHKVLSQSGPMTVPEIYVAMEVSGITPPAKDAIRIAMMRKPDIFINDNGKYRLVPAIEELLGGVEKELEAAEAAS